MERLKRKPAALGLCLGGVALMLSTLLTWLLVENDAGTQLRVRAASSQSGQTVFLLAFLAVVCGLGVLGSTGRGRIWWALLGLVAGGIPLVATIWGLFDPAWLAPYLLSEDALSDLGVSTAGSLVEAAQGAFVDSTLSASVRFGLLVGMAASVLVVLGALLSFRRPAETQG